MRKLYFLIGYIIVSLCLFGCNTTIHSNLNDENIENNADDIIGDEYVNSDPVSDIHDNMGEERNEKEKLADIYVKDLYNTVIDAVDPNGYYGTTFHSASVTYVSSLDINDIKAISYFVDRNTHVYSGFGTDFGCYYELNDLISTVERVFGPGVEIDTEPWDVAGLYFVYDESSRRFCGEPLSGGFEDIARISKYFGKYVVDGDYLYIYDKCLFSNHDRESGIIKFYSDINKTEESFVNEMQIGYSLPIDFSNDEALEQHGAEYKHIFKVTEDGTGYYWVSSEPNE